MKQITWHIMGWLLLSVNAQAAEVLPLDVHAIRYKGSLTGLETMLTDSGYIQSHGFAVKNGDIQQPWKIDMDMSAVEWCLRDVKNPRIVKKCIYTIQTVLERDANGYPKVKTEDALEFVPSRGFYFLDDDDECIDKTFPNHSVVAIGRWKARETPQVGGYAYSIKQAWILDPESKKFVETAPKDVVCEINEDRD